MIRRPPRSTLSSSSAASDVYKRQATGHRDPMTQHEVDLMVHGFMARGDELRYKRERAVRERARDEMSTVTSKPKISERTRELALNRQQRATAPQTASSVFTRLHSDTTESRRRKSCSRPLKQRAERSSRPKSADKLRQTKMRAAHGPAKSVPPFGTTGSRGLEPAASPTEGKKLCNTKAWSATDRMYRQGVERKMARDQHVINELRARGLEDPERLLSSRDKVVFRCWQ
eukprot:TRINITY_DN1479_c0_g1_i1.p1 TRINITY_DN1479_c0_g1~~TRINITY_DN1479_c0_g1_i1.p1  ORF type:complete len:230 (-),score=62.41 TRINITY_DN1479_c0_g1_i1:343-1032(-)